MHPSDSAPVVSQFTAYWKARSEYQRAKDEANAVLDEIDTVNQERRRLETQIDRLISRRASEEKITALRATKEMFEKIRTRYDRLWEPTWQRLHDTEETMNKLADGIDWTNYDVSLFNQIGQCVKGASSDNTTV